MRPSENKAAYLYINSISISDCAIIFIFLIFSCDPLLICLRPRKIICLFYEKIFFRRKFGEKLFCRFFEYCSDFYVLGELWNFELNLLDFFSKK